MAVATQQQEGGALGIRAHQAAMRALVAEYPERFEELKREHRVALGLPPTTGTSDEERIAKLNGG